MSESALQSTDKKQLFKCWKKGKNEIKANYDELLKRKRRIRLINTNTNVGRWQEDEHNRFLKACYEYRKNWRKIELAIKTRNIIQIRSHAQKYLIKLCKKYAIRLKTKTINNKKSVHLEWTEEDVNRSKNNKSDINMMNKYDRNFLNMFKYYDRDYPIKDSIKEDSPNQLSKEITSNKNKKFEYSVTNEVVFQILAKIRYTKTNETSLSFNMNKRDTNISPPTHNNDFFRSNLIQICEDNRNTIEFLKNKVEFKGTGEVTQTVDMLYSLIDKHASIFGTEIYHQIKFDYLQGLTYLNTKIQNFDTLSTLFREQLEKILLENIRKSYSIPMNMLQDSYNLDNNNCKYNNNLSNNGNNINDNSKNLNNKYH